MRRGQMWLFGRGGQILLWLVLLGAGFMLIGPDAAREWWPPQRARPNLTVVSASTVSGGAGWTAVAKAAMPAVVNIATARTVRGPDTRGGPFADPFSPYQAPGPRRERSLGSGVIVSADGYVLTNNHVIEGAQDIQVTLDDRREFKAKLIGGDARSDLAVVKLNGSGFTVIGLGDSSKVEVAEIVLAIGNPFGLSRTVTMGIVSAVGRANVGITDYEDFIQTDAAINPGNSGGALVNANGALIGINTAIFSQSGGSMGIGFAVPINLARQVMDQLVTRGRFTRGYIGVSVQELTPAMAEGLGLPVARGILVADVVPTGPAARAGLQRGDVILAIDGKPVNDVGHFRNQVASAAPGVKTRLTILRNGKEQTIETAIAEVPDRPTLASGTAPDESGPGLTVEDVTPGLARRLGLPPGVPGVVVIEVFPRGRAAGAGLRPGDVLQEINRQPVRSAREFARAVEQAGDRSLLVVVNRGGSTAYVVVGKAG